MSNFDSSSSPNIEQGSHGAPPVLSVENVSVELQGDLILKDVTFQLYHGDVGVLIGPSGGGKTVLLKTMAGIFEASQGRVLCYGHEWKKLSLTDRHQLAAKIGMQFQQSALFDELTAFENIAFVLREHTRMSESEIKQRVLECLRAVELEKHQNLREYELSGGMKKRLGLARAIALKPEILFLDDPTAGLDPITSDNMAELILSLKKQINATMVVVTHDILRAYQFAGRIFLVADQQVFETGNAEQTQKHPDPRIQQFIHGWLHGPLTDKREL